MVVGGCGGGVVTLKSAVRGPSSVTLIPTANTSEIGNKLQRTVPITPAGASEGTVDCTVKEQDGMPSMSVAQTVADHGTIPRSAEYSRCPSASSQNWIGAGNKLGSQPVPVSVTCVPGGPCVGVIVRVGFSCARAMHGSPSLIAKAATDLVRCTSTSLHRRQLREWLLFGRTNQLPRPQPTRSPS